MSKFDHSISLVKDQVLKILKVEDLVLEEFVNTTRSTDNNMRAPLPDNSELPLFRHTTDNRYDWDWALNVRQDLLNVSLDLLGQLSCGGDDQAQKGRWQVLQGTVLVVFQYFWQYWQGKGQGLSRAGLRCNQEIIVVLVLLKYLFLNFSWLLEPWYLQWLDNLII